MRHRPHLYIAGPWPDPEIHLDDQKRHHLTSVLRYPEGGAVTYTDGAGRAGSGRFDGQSVVRGREHDVAAPKPMVTVAVAVPKTKDRQRFVVEKLQELGTAHLRWLTTTRGQSGPPSSIRTTAWRVSALEQSRGSWLMTVDSVALEDLDDAVVAHPDGQIGAGHLATRDAVTLVIGPEGGLTDEEVARFRERLGLGRTILRSETAAIVAAAMVRRPDV